MIGLYWLLYKRLIIPTLESKMIESASLTVTGMKCGGCENNVTTKLKSMGGVTSATASRQDQAVTVEFDSNKTSLNAIKQAITETGYTVVDGH
jgi:copper chaperone